MQPRVLRFLSAAVFGGAALALGCPPEFFPDSYEPSPADLAENVQSAQVELRASAPQGDWILRVEVDGAWEVERTQPSSGLEERELGCVSPQCARREFELHCPRGTCAFSLELATTRAERGPLAVSAGFVFENDQKSDGCGDTNRNFVPAKDRERLFGLTWNVSDVVEAPEPLDAAADPVPPDGSASDAALPRDASSEDAADAPLDDADAATLQPVRVFRGDPARQDWWDLSVQGTGLSAYEGVIATVLIGNPQAPPERLGSGQARIENGAFVLAFPAVWEPSLYKLKRAYLDLDGNGRCDAASDLVFEDARAARIEALTIRPDPGSTPDVFSRSMNREEDCAALNALPAQ